MRFIAVALPLLRIELCRQRMTLEERRDAGEGGEAGTARAPLAVVIARPGGAVTDETSLLGGTRVDVVSPEARALGVRSGQTIASARARSSELSVRVVREDSVRDALARVAEACLAFGATVAFDESTDVAWIDVTGCAHLHAGPRDLAGEATLTSRVRARVRALGHTSRLAVADGPRVAAACARFARLGGEESAAQIVPPGKNREAMRVLPLAALPLPADDVAWLAKLGLRHVGDLQRLPPRALGTRLGPRAGDVMALVRGEDASPLTPYVPPAVLEERVELDEGVASTEALLFVAKALCRRVATRLAGQWIAASQLELVLRLDRAFVGEGQSRDAVFTMRLPVPVATEEELFAVLRARVEAIAIVAPAVAVGLRVPQKAPRPGTPLDLFAPEPRAASRLPRLVAELSAELGVERVGVLDVGDSWRIEERTRLVPFGTVPAPAPHEVPGDVEPVRLLPRPAFLARGRMLRHLRRVEAVQWWKAGASVARSDFVTCAAEGGLGFVEIESTGDAKRSWLRGWMA